MRNYYDHRAAEYDDWYLGRGLFADRDRVLTRHLRGGVIGLDQSVRMLDQAILQAPNPSSTLHVRAARSTRSGRSGC